jgi:hypothetical protein
MKKPFPLMKQTADVIAFSLLMITTALLITITNLYNRPGGDLYVSVYIENTLIDQYSLYENNEVRFLKADYDVLLGDIVLGIANQRIRILEETSPLNVCSNQGWIATPGMPLICAPNYFMAVIEVPK